MAQHIREATINDVSLMTRDMKPTWGRSFHDELKDQSAGVQSCFIAIADNRIDGSGFIRWAGPRPKIASRLFPSVCEIFRLFVREGKRSRNIGAQLVHAMETAARDREFTDVSVGVVRNNARAYEFYKRLGFRDTEITAYCDEYKYRAANGEPAIARHLCRYLLKEL